MKSYLKKIIGAIFCVITVVYITSAVKNLLLRPLHRIQTSFSSP